MNTIVNDKILSLATPEKARQGSRTSNTPNVHEQGEPALTTARGNKGADDRVNLSPSGQLLNQSATVQSDASRSALETPEQAGHPQLGYLRCDLSDLPPAYLLTAGFDPLRDEGEAYAERLLQFQVPVVHECYTDMIHAFISFAGGIPPGMDALARIGSFLGDSLND